MQEVRSLFFILGIKKIRKILGILSNPRANFNLSRFKKEYISFNNLRRLIKVVN